MFVTLPAHTASRACVLPWRLSRCATAAALRVLSRHLPPARVAWRTPRTDGKCASTLRLADARVSAARGPCRQAYQCRTRPHRCGLPAAAGCRPAAAGGRLSVTGSALVASRRYRLAEQPRGAYDGRLRDRRVRRQRRQYARRGVVEALRRGGACGPEACLAAARGRQQHVRRPLVHRRDAPGPGASRRQRADRVGHRACAVHVLYMPCVVLVCVVCCCPLGQPMPCDVKHRRLGRLWRAVFAFGSAVGVGASYLKRASS